MLASFVDVSIVVSTYNHQKYIRRALESVLSQKTNYSFEVIVADDCSSDGTMSIVEALSQQYPNIRALPSLENRGNSANTWEALKRATGKYVGFLEGDDYWTDDSKIQKLVSALESDSTLIGASHLISEVDEAGGPIASYPEWIQKETRVCLADFLNSKTYSNVASIYRNIFFDKDLLSDESFRKLFCFNRMVWDFTWCVYALSLGDVLVLPQSMSVYRTVTAGNVSNYNSRKSYFEIAEEHFRIVKRNDCYYAGRIDFGNIYCDWLFQMLVSSILESDEEKKRKYREARECLTPELTVKYRRSIPVLFSRYLKLYLRKSKFLGRNFLIKESTTGECAKRG